MMLDCWGSAADTGERVNNWESLWKARWIGSAGVLGQIVGRLFYIWSQGLLSLLFKTGLHNILEKVKYGFFWTDIAVQLENINIAHNFLVMPK